MAKHHITPDTVLYMQSQNSYRKVGGGDTESTGSSRTILEYSVKKKGKEGELRGWGGGKRSGGRRRRVVSKRVEGKESTPGVMSFDLYRSTRIHT